MSKLVRCVSALVAMWLMTGATVASAQGPIKIGAFGPMTAGRPATARVSGRPSIWSSRK